MLQSQWEMVLQSQWEMVPKRRYDNVIVIRNAAKKKPCNSLQNLVLRERVLHRRFELNMKNISILTEKRKCELEYSW